MVRPRLVHIASPLILAIAAFGCVASAGAADLAPATRAARLTYIQGAVTVNQAGNSESLPGQVNLPLLSGDQVTTGGDGQAEVEFEDGSVVRLTPNSALSLDNLTVGADGVFVTNLSLLQGLAYCELRATPEYQYTLGAGGDILSPVENTTVRVNFDEAPASFAVLDGTAEVELQGASDAAGAGYQTQVRAGESLRRDPADAGRYFLTQDIVADSWDQWNQDMDQTAAAQASDSTTVRDDYAGAEGYGWSDLDANGNWYNVPGEGPVWQPQVAEVDSSFDPYGNGAWVWYPGAGYVWASGYAWGWTPYRCGNWSFYSGFGWGWAPGAGCGGLGWGFSAGGYPVNIGQFPPGYRPIRIPIARPGPIHPILPVRSPSAPKPLEASAAGGQGPRSIGGVRVTPIAPIHGSAVLGGTASSSSLGRDFPIDSSTHSHVLGLASTSPAVVHVSPQQGAVRSQAQPAGMAPPAPAAYGGQSYPQNGQARPAPAGRTEPYSPPVQRPIQQNAPAGRPAPAYVPRTAPVQPRTYTPQPPRPSYSAPPSISRPASAPPPPRPATPAHPSPK